MATENSTLTAPEEQTSPVTEDVQPETGAMNQSKTSAEPETSEPQAAPAAQPDFSDEDAALDAQEAGLDAQDETDETDEERANAQPAPAEDPFAGRGKEELVALFTQMLADKPVQAIRREVDALKIAFYRLRRAEVEAARKHFIDEGGLETDFAAPVDSVETEFKELFKQYQHKRNEYIAGIEADKEQNLKTKQAIIEELKELVNSDETLNQTFTKFRELQQRWKETGPVPQQNLKDIWATYNLHVENFYNFIKINRELRDLDLKKNYEQKIALCEEAEQLIEEPSAVEAFRKLQKLHDEWRETGPVANEFKEPLWERFKEASSRINKLHQAYFDELKGEQTKNLELKTALCVQTEELAAQPLTTRKEWDKAGEKLLEIQKVWKTIGFAPKKENTRIYARFRAACDKFFEAKRQYYATLKVEMDQNLLLKTELCEAAESLINSEEWKKTTDELIALQARWKEIGAVSRRHSDAIWKRFRAACDGFFARKAEHFAEADGEQEENLRRKLALLDEMAAADVKAGGYDLIRTYQQRWGEIGYVPVKQKESVQKRYKAALDELFNSLRGGVAARPRDKGGRRTTEGASQASGRGDLKSRIHQLEQEIALLENNIGFFAHSKNAESLIADVQQKIDRAREELAAAIKEAKEL